jgi:CheY-like chemotaxis protein
MGGIKALNALFPGARRLILLAMFTEPERWFSLTELAGRAGVRPTTLLRHVVHLREGGLIREKEDGGRPWFQVDPGCPVFAEMQSMMTKLAERTSARETILVVEDQEATARITRILLESWGYRVLEAHGGAEAISLFERHDGEIHLLLTDMIMPGMDGAQLADELVRRKPGLRVVFMSGYPSDEALRNGQAFLPKPFNPVGLSRAIRRELDREIAAPPMKAS